VYSTLERLVHLFQTLVFALTVLLSTTVAEAQSTFWELKREQSIYPVSPQKGLQAHVHVYLPPGFERRRSPVIVYLHGAGERGKPPEVMQNTAIAARLRTHPDFPFIVVSPQLVTDAPEWDPDEVHALLDEILPKLPADLKRLYVTGMSMGGTGVWRLAFARPGRFSAIAPVATAQKLEGACRIKTVPVWAFHNDPDTYFPMAYSVELVQALQRCDGKAQITLYKRAGHNAWTEAYKTDALYDWLLSNVR
jgi:predicted peptidase